MLSRLRTIRTMLSQEGLEPPPELQAKIGEAKEAKMIALGEHAKLVAHSLAIAPVHNFGNLPDMNSLRYALNAHHREMLNNPGY